MSVAQRVTGPTGFDLGPYRVEVLRANEGWHLRVVAGPFPGGNVVTVANFMPDDDTPAQLRALARHLDKVLMP
jgi:hypothetical protein